MSSALLSGEGNRFVLSGELGFDTVITLLEQSRTTLFGGDTTELQVELADLSRVDSAGLALLLQWMRMARDAGKTISYHNIPQQLLDIARAGEVDTLLPIGG